MTSQQAHFSHPKYRPDIDGLRAVAVISVVVFHAFPSWLRGGFIGVDVFFVISGFLISTIVFENLRKGTFSFGEFYSRRVRRIFPALLLVFAASLGLGWFVMLADEYALLGKHVSAGALFVSNLELWSEAGYFDSSRESKPLLHLWSLGVEEQFYILWPVVLWLAWRLRRNLAAPTLFLAAVSFALNVAGIRRDAAATFYSPQTRFWEILCGSLLAWVVTQESLPERIPQWSRNFSGDGARLARNVLSFLGLSLLVFGFWKINRESHFPGKWALVPVSGALLSLAAGPTAWVNRRVYSHPYAVWIGGISYPLYLWHWPLLSFARINEGAEPAAAIRVAVVALSFGLAWLTYQLIERRWRFGPHASAKVTALVSMMVLLAGGGFALYRGGGLAFRAVVLKNREVIPEVPVEPNPAVPCEEIRGLASTWCNAYPAKTPEGKIILWGDSSTVAWLPVFHEVAKERNFSLINVSHPSCPPLLHTRKSEFGFSESKDYCADGLMQRNVLSFIARQKPDFVVLIVAWNSYSRHSNREFITN
jgi:peptidoglycan/LPS O-acetylase OafA/YrhL